MIIIFITSLLFAMIIHYIIEKLILQLRQQYIKINNNKNINIIIRNAARYDSYK